MKRITTILPVRKGSRIISKNTISDNGDYREKIRNKSENGHQVLIQIGARNEPSNCVKQEPSGEHNSLLEVEHIQTSVLE